MAHVEVMIGGGRRIGWLAASRIGGESIVDVSRMFVFVWASLLLGSFSVFSLFLGPIFVRKCVFVLFVNVYLF